MLSVVEIVVGALDALNLLDFLYCAFSDWRYLLSPSYRTRIHARWQQSTQLRITAEVIGSLICAAATLFLVGLLICAILGAGWFAAHPQ